MMGITTQAWPTKIQRPRLLFSSYMECPSTRNLLYKLVRGFPLKIDSSQFSISLGTIAAIASFSHGRVEH